MREYWPYEKVQALFLIACRDVDLCRCFVLLIYAWSISFALYPSIVSQESK